MFANVAAAPSEPPALDADALVRSLACGDAPPLALGGTDGEEDDLVLADDDDLEAELGLLVVSVKALYMFSTNSFTRSTTSVTVSRI